MKVISFGECMLEVKVQEGLKARFGYGGDTFNTAYYLAQLGVNSAYATALGKDNLSQWLLNDWQESGISTKLVTLSENKTPGIYTIHTDEQGERSFNYWRENSAARFMLNDKTVAQLLSNVESGDMFYFSLISIAILIQDSRPVFLELLKNLASQGVTLAFDNNYRPSLWPDRKTARSWVEKVTPWVDIYLPSKEDEMAIFELSEAESADHFSTLEIPEIVVKNGGQSCQLLQRNTSSTVELSTLKPLDTTAAGDSFNAGYLAARSLGRSPNTAARAGHYLASQVIMHEGSLVPFKDLDLEGIYEVDSIDR